MKEVVAYRVIFILTLFFLASCVSKEYNENVKGIISCELDDNLNKLSKQHLICFKCETGSHPTSVPEIVDYKAVTEQCSKLFTGKPFDFIDPVLANHKITTKNWEDRTTYVFTSAGVEYEDFDSVKGESAMTMNIWFNEFQCSHNNALHRTSR